MKILFMLLLAMCAACAADGQAFWANEVTGNVSLLKAGGAERVRKGKPLPATGSLRLAPGSRIQLICEATNSPMNLSVAQDYDLTALSRQCQAAGEGLASGFWNFVKHSLAPHASHPENERHKYMKAIGGASRSGDCVYTDPALDTTVISQHAFPLIWLTGSKNTSARYVLCLYDDPASKTPVFCDTTTDSRMSISRFQSRLSPGKTYYWIVSISGMVADQCPKGQLTFWSAIQHDSIMQTFDALTADAGELSAKAFMKGFLLEDAHAFGEASFWYHEAVRLAPKNKLYRKVLRSYMDRYYF